MDSGSGSSISVGAGDGARIEVESWIVFYGGIL